MTLSVAAEPARLATPPASVVRRSGGRWIDRGLVTLVAVPIVLAAVSVLVADRSWLVGQVPDDAYYYLEIGERIAAGDGATFDGINATNPSPLAGCGRRPRLRVQR